VPFSRKQTVLIVEDDAMLRGILAESLAAEGSAVLTADDGEAALAIASTVEQPGLVVTDLLLPGMDGWDLASQLGSLKPSPPVLFISGVRTVRPIPGPVLLKPFGPGAFLGQVHRILPSFQQH
jgi:DNA-binding response OmpR family regulator